MKIFNLIFLILILNSAKTVICSDPKPDVDVDQLIDVIFKGTLGRQISYKPFLDAQNRNVMNDSWIVGSDYIFPVNYPFTVIDRYYAMLPFIPQADREVLDKAFCKRYIKENLNQKVRVKLYRDKFLSLCQGNN